MGKAHNDYYEVALKDRYDDDDYNNVYGRGEYHDDVDHHNSILLLNE